MLRLKSTKLGRLMMALTLFSLFTTTSEAQECHDCSDGACQVGTEHPQSTQHLDSGRVRYSYPSYSEERFPEFPDSRAVPRYRPVAPRLPDSTRPIRTQFHGSRADEWQRYQSQSDRIDRLRDYARPSRSREYSPDSRQYHYSGFDYDGDQRSRQIERRYRFPIENRDIDDLRGLRDQLENEYRSLPRRDRNENLGPRDRSQGVSPGSRYRNTPPEGRYRNSTPQSRFRNGDPQDRYRNGSPQDRYRNGAPQNRYRNVTPRDRYEPESRDAQEPTLDQKVTARYSDPTVIRFATALNSNQGLALFREVSSLIDQRHLSPKSYGQRMGEAVRSLQVVMQNRAFQSAVPMGSARTDQFRSQLGRLAVQGVSNRSEAEQFVRSVMQLGSQTGVRPGLIAYEFANASVQSLDKFSSLDPTLHRVSGQVDESDTRTAQILDDQYVTGVGIEVRHHAEGLEIVRVLSGGPAVAAGIQGGDIIQAIDGRDIGGTEMNASVSLIGGPAGTPIRFQVSRESRGTRTFTLFRRRFRVYSVNDVKMVDRQTGYLHLGKFARNSTAEMERAIQDLQSQGMRNLVVDVRGNPGGLLTTAIEISDKFLRCGRIVATRGRLASDNSVETASASGTWSMPLVVLVDKDSASASEIFAAAVQENGRGLVVGERSYGKGTVQTHFPLSSGLGTVKLTTAKFYSPNDREMSGAGVTPDVRSSDEKDTLTRAITAASHPRLAEMVAQHGTCRPNSRSFGGFGSAEKPADGVTAVLGN